MSERTTDEIATIFEHAGHSVKVINTLAALSSLTDEQKDSVKRNVEHLELMVALEDWGSEDMTASKAAITNGKAYVAS